MKIISVKKIDLYCLSIKFDDGQTRILDCAPKIPTWYSSGNVELIRIAENFSTAHVDKNGNLAFRCGHENLFIDSDEVFKKSVKTKDADKTIKLPETKKTSGNGTQKPVKCQDIKANTNKGRYSLGEVVMMKMKDVLNTKSNALKFDGIWRDFLGEPEPNFYMNLSGQPGSGKSTFCVKFGNYLASKFGDVAYFTNEENAPRMKRKLETKKKENKEPLADNYYCFFNVNSYDIVRKLISDNNFRFVFIDSVQGGGMDATELWNLHCSFPNIAIIAISRQTKTGEARGSQNKEYDGDITIVFDEPGHAHTEKNRFGELSEMQVFQAKARKKRTRKDNHY